MRWSVVLRLDGMTQEQVTALQHAFRSDKHVHLADVFGHDSWRMTSIQSAAVGVGLAMLEVGAYRAPSDLPSALVDKFGNRTE